MKKCSFFVVLTVLVCVLFVPTFVRFYSGNSYFIGAESFYHFRVSKELISEGEYKFFDPPVIEDIAYMKREYTFTPYHYLLVYLSHFLSLITASRILPFIFGLLSVFVFRLILKKFFEEDYKVNIILLLLVVSPAFIYSFTVSSPLSAVIFFSLASLYCFMKKGRLNYSLCLMFLILVSFFSVFNSLLVLAVFLAYVIRFRVGQGRLIVGILLASFISLSKGIIFYVNYSFVPGDNLIRSLLSDLGSVIGFGIFTLVLAVYAVISSWKNKSSFFWHFIISVVLFVCLFFMGNMVNAYLVFFVSVAAGVGFFTLYESEWTIDVLKNLALLIVVCGLLFSTVSYVNRLAMSGPDKDMVDSLVWLGSTAFKDRFVLAAQSDGYIISTIARTPVLADSFLSSDYNQEFLYKVQDSLFYSKKIVQARQLIDAYHIQYVYITPEMKSGGVWYRSDEGLLFLLTSPSTFEKVYDAGGYEVWEVVNTSIAMN